MNLKLKNLACGYNNKIIIDNITMHVRSGEILCILGPNGVGKTTLFKTILGFLKIQDGEILLDGQDLKKLSQKQLSKAISYVPQAHTLPFPYTVYDVVLMGRTVHMGAFLTPSQKDRQIASESIDVLGIGYLKEKTYTEISGGERQMVLIARALAQQSQIMILDEPTSNLDFGNQVKVLEQINKLAARGIGIIMTSHFPDHAFLCSAKVALIERGRIFKIGSMDEVITEENLKSMYGIDVKIISVKDQYGNVIKSCIPLLSNIREGD
ncbi:iron complex transport system ATP-binding protein [Clostridium acetobutylicum]|uniref:ABC-type iron (III) transport system, ATPase component n=1 Tax=Clostridium acetobutylicum (strain ATCC 824 / DSM 792 / JCM 1419 / IAM 19013 / LMG 5710 / NBRC 13948 / NRRL B-527 / VKM B-1787 / 2291 / W) TaxID=272562 RepID=Q97HM2_CLOAB|nr:MULTISPECIES: ABC transporter ATP-binding protein [Clostridium]AAK79948.1 ABC-type iron (III) transport system, ATPase component [Clostridium acetobutylicum ATCC 824]ADZ21041.1 ABC-type iron (III) transport system, ATPase component [Clostridium acetobutylicum EA 2018]AEI34643.1 ABC-type iron (III) transport system, ATPase component [Clostridium acetobutylicum DSM 1731]AWV79620.1 ABC transporter ATP-binding protein [Clostridium acetobutylicum]MBC2394407.1 ABC transporter ATP-binding protein 